MPHSSAFPPIGQSFIVLPTVDSTNNYAMAMLKDGQAQHGNAFFALEQTAGKGQRGRSWVTGSGQNIALSVVLQPGSLPLSNAFLLSAAVALACYDLLKKFGATEDWRIKWPNDLYWQDRKAGGILIENLIRGQQWIAAIAGIGLNINQESFPDSAGRAVSLRQITGRSFDLLALAREYCLLLQDRWEQLAAGDDLLDDYNNALFRRNEMVLFRRQEHHLRARVLGVTPNGGLRLSDSGREWEIQSGEMEWINEG